MTTIGICSAAWKHLKPVSTLSSYRVGRTATVRVEYECAVDLGIGDRAMERVIDWLLLILLALIVWGAPLLEVIG